jgi:hypothetical protein
MRDVNSTTHQMKKDNQGHKKYAIRLIQMHTYALIQGDQKSLNKLDSLK